MLLGRWSQPSLISTWVATLCCVCLCLSEFGSMRGGWYVARRLGPMDGGSCRRPSPTGPTGGPANLEAHARVDHYRVFGGFFSSIAQGDWKGFGWWLLRLLRCLHVTMLVFACIRIRMYHIPRTHNDSIRQIDSICGPVDPIIHSPNCWVSMTGRLLQRLSSDRCAHRGPLAGVRAAFMVRLRPLCGRSLGYQARRPYLHFPNSFPSLPQEK